MITSLLASQNYCLYNSEIAKRLSPLCAIILGELCSEYEYWRKSNQLTEDGFFFSTQENLYERTGIKEYQQRQTIKELKGAGLIEVDRRGMPAKNYFKINESALVELLSDGSSVKIKEQVLKEPRDMSLKNHVQSIHNNNTKNKIDSVSSEKGALFSAKPVIKAKKQRSAAALFGMINVFTEDEKLQESLKNYLSNFRIPKRGIPAEDQWCNILEDLKKYTSSTEEMIQKVRDAYINEWMSFIPPWEKTQKTNKPSFDNTYGRELPKAMKDYTEEERRKRLAVNQDGSLKTY